MDWGLKEEDIRYMLLLLCQEEKREGHMLVGLPSGSCLGRGGGTSWRVLSTRGVCSDLVSVPARCIVGIGA
jgi:hypothetical protein